MIALIITIIVIIILAAISIAGVSGIVERSRYAKFCGDLDAVQDAVSQAYGTKRIKEAQNPDGLKTSEEIYKWVATGGVDGNLETAKGPNGQDLYKLADDSVLGLDLPKYGDSDWGVDPKTGEVFLVDGFEYDDHVYYGKVDVQNGGKEKGEEGDAPEEPSEKGVYAKLYNDGTLILSSTDYEAPDHTGVKTDYGTQIYNEYDYPQWRGEVTDVIISDKIQPTDTHWWFNRVKGTIEGLENIDTSNVANMRFMFSECSNLTTLDLSDWDVGSVENMRNVFWNCKELETLEGISGWNTGSVKNMNSMFENCSSLTTLDLSGWNVENVTGMSNMFDRCSALTTIDLSGWNIQTGTNLNSMFASCSNLATVYVRNEDIKTLLKNGNAGAGISESQIEIKSEGTANDDAV